MEEYSVENICIDTWVKSSPEVSFEYVSQFIGLIFPC
jgi:hypothetical protein